MRKLRVAIGFFQAGAVWGLWGRLSVLKGYESYDLLGKIGRGWGEARIGVIDREVVCDDGKEQAGNHEITAIDSYRNTRL